MSNLANLTVLEASTLLEKGEITAVDIIKDCLSNIEKYKDLNAFITVAKTEALAAAKESDARRAKGTPLSNIDGIPYAIKDSFCSKDILTTAGSKMLDDFVPPYDAEVVTKLNEAGAIMLGKTNLDQFGHGSSTENSAYGSTKNPYDQTRVPGGSSGGSAVAVAANLCLFAIGEDTGGSIRQPASFTNTTGLKVTYGRVSRFGSIAYASSLDTVGPMTKNVADAAIILEHIAGADIKDATSAQVKPDSYTKDITKTNKNLTIGLPKEFFAEGVDSQVKEVVLAATNKLKKEGFTLKEISIPVLTQSLACYYIIAWAETSSNLARYDGVHYGHSSLKKGETGSNLYDVYAKSRAAGFSTETKRRIMLGTYVLSAGYFDAYYKKALKVRTAIVNGFAQAFSQVDVIIAPVSPILPFKFGAKSDPLEMYLADILTTPINPAGVPSLALPAGFVEQAGKTLPVGMQIIGPQFSESKIMNLGHFWQSIDETNKTNIMNAKDESKLLTGTAAFVIILALALVAVIGIIVSKSTTKKTSEVLADEKPIMETQEEIKKTDYKSADFALLETSKGRIIVELYAEGAPKTVTNFVTLANRGFYDNLLFHRVVKDFVIQGVDPLGNGSGGESIYGEPFEDEINAESLGLSAEIQKMYEELYKFKYRTDISSKKIEKGTLAMANQGVANTNTSQFFIVTGDIQGSLDGKHTAFGRVIEGSDVVQAINVIETDTRNDRPIELITIKTIITGDSIDEIKNLADKKQSEKNETVPQAEDSTQNE